MRPSTGGTSRRASRDVGRITAVAALPPGPAFAFDAAGGTGAASAKPPPAVSSSGERRWTMYKRLLGLLCLMFAAALGVSLWFMLGGSSFAKAFGLKEGEGATPPPTSRAVVDAGRTSGPTIPVSKPEAPPPSMPSTPSAG